MIYGCCLSTAGDMKPIVRWALLETTWTVTMEPLDPIARQVQIRCV